MAISASEYNSKTVESRIIRLNYPEEVELRYVRLGLLRGIFVARQPRVPPAGQAWAKDGACQENKKVDFVPPGRTPAAEIRQAVRICMACPVNHHCFEEAMDNPSKLAGLWGGTDQQDRKNIRQVRPQKPEKELNATELGAAILDTLGVLGIGFGPDRDPAAATSAVGL